jgi:CubicO group peptidase (beta-lactamase class C family)
VLEDREVTGVERVLEEELLSWPAPAPAAAVLLGPDSVVSWGPELAYPWASVTKLLTALVVLDAVWQGRVDLEEPAGPAGSTVRHLLAHASGLSADSDRVLAPPGRRRIYSNRGYEVLGDLVEHRSGLPFRSLLAERVLEPLGLRATSCEGSPAHGAQGPVGDLVLLARELLGPRHFAAPEVAVAATTTFPGLAGVLPGFGRQDPNDWGLGPEVRGLKDPHWTSHLNSPATFGHFGQAGAFLWVDPVRDLAAVAVTDTPFGPWAARAWPRFSTRVVAGAGSP